MRKIFGMCLLAVFIPYIVTLAWTGRVEGNLKNEEDVKRTVLLDRGSVPSSVDLEEYLIGVTALQVPASCEKETLKAQAIIARTYLRKQMGENMQIKESELSMDYLAEGKMEKLWGKDNYLEYYKKIRDAVEETRGQVILYDDTFIDPLFHQISAGKTREGDDLHPFLQSVDAHLDLEAPNYISMVTFSREELATKLNAMSDSPNLQPEQVLESIQIVEKDEAGYVKTIQMGTKSYVGEDVAYALGFKSSAFAFENYEGSVRCTVKGSGHGYGFDQYGAEQKAKEGWKAEDLLKFYYKNIVVISE